MRPSATSAHHSLGHQVQHLVIFGATAFVYRALVRGPIAFCWVAALALFIESAQFFMYHTPDGFEWWDLRDDAIGAAVVLLLSARYFQSAVKTLNS
jgi:hypothetical protein